MTPNVPCVFPFNYEGTTYTECTTIDNFAIPWCSTEVDSNGKFVRGKWGDCSPGCLGESEGAYSQNLH